METVQCFLVRTPMKSQALFCFSPPPRRPMSPVMYWRLTADTSPTSERPRLLQEAIRLRTRFFMEKQEIEFWYPFTGSPSRL